MITSPWNLGEHAWKLDRPKLIAAGIPEKRGTLELSGDGDVRGTRPEDLAMLNENPSWRLQDTLWMARMTVAWSAWILLIGGVLAVAALWREQAITGLRFRSGVARCLAPHLLVDRVQPDGSPGGQ
jgi:hypothetical protein